MASQSSAPFYLFLMFKKNLWLAVVVHVFNSSTEKAETGGSL